MAELKNQSSPSSEILALHPSCPQNLQSGPSGMCKRILELLDKQSESRRETETKLLRLLDEKSSKLRGEVANESKARFESIDHLKFQDNFSHDYTQFDEADNEIMKKIDEETVKFDEALDDQRESLAETEKAMNEIIADMSDKIRKEVDDEK